LPKTFGLKLSRI